MNKQPATKDVTTTDKPNGWKIAKDITIALAPTVIVVTACVLIAKKLEKDIVIN